MKSLGEQVQEHGGVHAPAESDPVVLQRLVEMEKILDQFWPQRLFRAGA
jgi:hypothetical protein